MSCLASFVLAWGLAGSPAGVGAGAATPVEDAAAPPAPKVKRAAARAMILGGGLGFAILYGGTTAGAAATLDDAPSRNEFRQGLAMAIPVVGPIRAAAIPAGSKGDRAAMAALGVLQLGALTMMTTGIVRSAQWLRRDEWDRARGRPIAPGQLPPGKLIGAGTGVATVGYLITMGIGVSQLRAISRDPTRYDDPARARAFGRRLTIPIVGGLVAMPQARSHLAAWGAGLTSAFQLAGVGTAVLGGVLRRKRERDVQVAASAGPQGAWLGLSGRL